MSFDPGPGRAHPTLDQRKAEDPFAEEPAREDLPDLPESLWDCEAPGLPAEMDAASGEHEWEPAEAARVSERPGLVWHSADEFRALALSGRVAVYRCRKCGTSVLIPPSEDLDLGEFDGSVPTCSEVLAAGVHDL